MLDTIPPQNGKQSARTVKRHNADINFDLYYEYYFLTLTLPSSLYNNDVKIQHNMTMDLHNEYLRHYNRSTVAEMTTHMNIHYHSIIQVPTKRDEYMLYRSIYGLIATHKFGSSFTLHQFTSIDYLKDRIQYIQKGHDDSIEYNYLHCIHDTFGLIGHFKSDDINEIVQHERFIKVKPKKVIVVKKRKNIFKILSTHSLSNKELVNCVIEDDNDNPKSSSKEYMDALNYLIEDSE